METEQQLLDAINNGDPKAMRRLYDRFSGYTMAIVLRYIPEREDARDVLQDSFVHILTSVRQFNYRGEGSLKSWVSRVTANCALDWLKHHQRLQMTDKIPDGIDENVEIEIHGVPPDILNKMIGRLPVGCRTVLNLHVFERLTHKEIAQRLDIREASSASQFSHAKQLLREMINDYLNSQQI